MQMIHDSLMPEALSKFLRDEALRPVKPVPFTTTLVGGGQATAFDMQQDRLAKLQAELSAKHDRAEEEADRRAFEKRALAAAIERTR